MAIRRGEREQQVYTLDFADAVEALIQYIEAKTAQRVFRPADVVLNMDSERKTLSVVLSRPPVMEDVTPPPSKGELH